MPQCPFQTSLDLLGKKHVLTILWALNEESPRRFNELKSDVDVNAVTLTERLGDLEAAGIIDRQAFAEIPPRVEYSLTEQGRDLMPLMDDLDTWAAKWRDTLTTAPVR